MAWMAYGNGMTRFDPASGEVQVAGNLDSGGPSGWYTVGNINQPWAGQAQSSMFPSPDQITMMKNIAAASAAQQGGTTTGGAQGSGGSAAGATGAGGSYYGAGAAGATGAGTTSGGTGGGGGTNMATTTATQIPNTVSLPQWQTWYNQNIGKTILVNGNPVTINQDIDPTSLLNAFRNNQVGWGQLPGQQQPSAEIGGAGGPQPEQVALGQMAQIDPITEALRQQVAASYLGTTFGGPPSAADVRSYLDLYNQIDPTGLAGRQQLGQDLATQEALGTQLDPVTQRQIEQSVRRAQAARGNVYGTPQLVQEAMTTGQAGLALQQQRQAALQGFYQSGQDVGNVAQSLYQTGLANQLARRQAALSYLGSGQTPYQAGASYLNTAENRAAAAAQGGPVYNPQGISPYYTGAGTSSFPQYGLDVSQLANQWQQSMNYGQYAGYNAQLAASQAGGGNKGASAGMGAAKGAASGALTGMAAGPWGALIGAGVGALGGAASGYFSG